MTEQHFPGSDEVSLEVILASLANAERRTNRMILIGAPGWVRKIIHLLYVARVTEVRDWSQLVRTRNPNEVISLMQRPKVEE